MQAFLKYLIIVILPLELIKANVFINQAGYLSNLPKIFYTDSATDSFYVVDVSTGNVAFKDGLFYSVSNDPATGLTLYGGEFSSLETDGSYFIRLSNGDSSFIFTITPDVFEDALNKTLKGYYFQRCGTALLQANAGVYFHPTCHSEDGYYHSSTGQSGFRLTTGGWHDAGDYGKYIVNAGISVGTLLLAYENFPEKFNMDDLNIPESGNGVPDLLDEVRYELEWFLTMQKDNGGIYFKITKEQFESFIMPNNDSGTRYIYELSSNATADFAAVMAMAARIFQTYDSQFGEQCLNASLLGWNYLSSNPTIVPPGGFTNPSGTFTGVYGDNNDSDERLWAASELFETTGQSVYHDYFTANYNQGGIINSTQWWGNLKNLALLTYLKSKQSSSNQSLKNQIKNSLTAYCNTLVNRVSANGFGVTINPGEYTWGCNSDVLNKALLLIFGYEEIGNVNYYESALMQLNYILGTNAHNFSFITGVGTNSVMHPHHRPSASDGIVNPVPGLLAGGPDQYLDDPVLQSHFNGSTPPALCYIDDVGSYASNEIAINWNAPLVFVLGYFNGEGLTAVDDHGFNLIPENFNLEQNYPNPFNPVTKISWQSSVDSWQTLTVYDALGNEVSELVNEYRSAGVYESDFIAEGLSSGIYFYTLKAKNSIDGSEKFFVETKKMLLLK
jgi:endoglucanase